MRAPWFPPRWSVAFEPLAGEGFALSLSLFKSVVVVPLCFQSVKLPGCQDGRCIPCTIRPNLPFIIVRLTARMRPVAYSHRYSRVATSRSMLGLPRPAPGATMLARCRLRCRVR
jgi:hypothetical protein